MTEPLAYLHGSLVRTSQAHLSLHDAGFVFGVTVTDLCRTFQHRLYRWADHLGRFRQSCRLAHIAAAIDESELSRIAEKLVKHNAALIDAGDDLALVLFATPGPVGYYLGEPTAPNDRPTLGMHTFPLPFARYRPWIAQGATLVTPSIPQVPSACVDPHIKQRSRMHWWLAEQEVRRSQPGAQALLLDEAGHVTETASANFLLVKDGMLVSPPVESILEGVSLKVVTELCRELGIPMAQRNITLDECYAADEALLTCTSYCLVGVRQINGRPLPWPGPMLQCLLERWSAAVGVSIHQQILAG